MKGRGLKNKKGITLIALVITIIVLLILAGVAIAMLSGENGILRKAADAKTKTEEGQEREEMSLVMSEGRIRKITNKEEEIGEVTIGGEETTLIKAMNQIANDESNTGAYSESEQMSGAVNYATKNNSIIKLNKNVYVYDKMKISEEKTVVIDLNGNSLIFIDAKSAMFGDDVYTYIIDDSVNKTGKIMILEDDTNYNYLEKADVNKDGKICQADANLIKANFGKSSKDADWELCKSCDTNDSNGIDVGDFTIFSKCKKIYKHLEDVLGNVFLNIGEKGIVTQCGCNK